MKSRFFEFGFIKNADFIVFSHKIDFLTKTGWLHPVRLARGKSDRARAPARHPKHLIRAWNHAKPGENTHIMENA